MKKKVLFFLETLGGGGAEKVLFNIVKYLDKSKYDVTVKIISNSGVYDDDINKNCNLDSYLDIKMLDKGLISKAIYYIKYKLIHMLPGKLCYKILIKEKYDIEIAFIEGYPTKIIGSYSNKKSKKIAWIHVDPIERDYADLSYKNLEQHKNIYKKFDQVICVSKSVAKSTVSKYDLENDKVIVQYNPIDTENIKFLSKDGISIDNSKMNLITIGRLVHQKGYDRLLNVVKRLKNDGLDFNLIILGEGEERQYLERYIIDNKLEKVVNIVGFVKNPYKYLYNSDLFVCSSRAEGFSLVIAEALVLGIPVISTSCSGPNELLEFGKFGMLVNNDEESLYKGLENIIKNKLIYEELVKKSKQRSKWFNCNSIIKQIENEILS